MEKEEVKERENSSTTAKLFKKTITYTSKIVTDEDGDNFPVRRKIKVITSHVKQYDGTEDILVTLSTCARNLIAFICREMDSEAMIRNDAHTKRKFRLHIKDVTEGSINYSEASMNIAFSDLCKKRLLTSKGKGLFKVNPFYFYRNSDANRLNTIKEELEIRDEKLYNELNKVQDGK